MGFNTSAIRFFLATKHTIKIDPKTMIIGRQSFSPSIGLLAALRLKKLVTDWKYLTYIDDFLACSGVKDKDFLDMNDYEGANILHDLNKPIPEKMRHSYDLVIEAGTLEHVPDFLMGFENVKSMVRVGGDLIIISPANNFLGHGCYQLSPELFFRGLSFHQGFEIKHLLIHQEGIFGGKWFAVPDSQVLGRRVDFETRRATYICLIATRVGEATGELQNQADYESVWNDEVKISRLGQVYNDLPYVLKRIIHFWILRPKYRLISRRNIQRITTRGLLRLPAIEKLYI